MAKIQTKEEPIEDDEEIVERDHDFEDEEEEEEIEDISDGDY